MYNIFSVGSLNEILSTVTEPGSHLIDTYFPGILNSDREAIYFEEQKELPRISPFVSPLVEGKVVDGYGSNVKSFQPAYVKDKRRFTATAAVKRMQGEPFGGSMTPMQRLTARIRQDTTDQMRMLRRRWEVMCSELLRTGKVTVEGDDYPTQVVDFGRAAGLTVTLTTTARWGEAGVDPLADLESWATLVQDESSGTSTTVTMDPKAWALFSASDAVKDRLDYRRGTSQDIDIDPRIRPVSRARYMGSLGDFNFWVYRMAYRDDNGVTQNVMPDHTVIIGGPDAEGFRGYGMIMDEEANFQSSEYYVKSWLQKDPAVRWMLLQAAPLPIFFRVNATFCATVR